ncbi:hypothetical protein [Aliiroseovarius subalbicans]|uniref:hypothetical protein n=1 Tax=Aliiroseovarius subalbicans TaxID=2925840 RepID=UPI001F56BBD0|nr:hypothetical protein [Aliiroseovarius subalbicans]MCI2399134.1 hypothetical protein [Aliiroseovarius subalbicans]
MSYNEKEKMVRRAVKQHFVEWAYVEVDEWQLVLGDKFSAEVERVVHARDAQVKVFEGYFGSFDAANLRAALGEQEVEGFGLRETEIEDLRKKARNALAPYNRFTLTALGARPDDVADYKTWSLRDSYNAPELTWLSIGLEPSDDLEGGSGRLGSKSNRIDPFVAKERQKRLEIIYCSKKLGIHYNSSRRASAQDAWEWIKSIDLRTPSGFRTMLETSGRRVAEFNSNGSLSTPPLKKEDAKIDPRAVRSISKLIAAMAKDGYGWNHKDLRSPIPGELESLCDQLGVPVSRETILKYMRMGATFFPGETD